MKPDAPVATDYSRAQTLAEELEAVATRYRAGALLPGTFLARLINNPLSLGSSSPVGIDVGVTGVAAAVRTMGESRGYFSDATKAAAVRVALASDRTLQADI